MGCGDRSRRRSRRRHLQRPVRRLPEASGDHRDLGDLVDSRRAGPVRPSPAGRVRRHRVCRLSAPASRADFRRLHRSRRRAGPAVVADLAFAARLPAVGGGRRRAGCLRERGRGGAHKGRGVRALRAVRLDRRLVPDDAGDLWRSTHRRPLHAQLDRRGRARRGAAQRRAGQCRRQCRWCPGDRHPSECPLPRRRLDLLAVHRGRHRAGARGHGVGDQPAPGRRGAT